MLQFYAEITQILRNLRNRYALLRRLRTVTHRYADGNLLMLNDLFMPALMVFLCFLGQECFPSTFLGVLACLQDLLPLVTCPVYGDIPPIIHLDHPHLLLSFSIVVGYDSRDSQTDGRR